MMKRVPWLSTLLPEKNRLVWSVIILLLLISLACTLPDVTTLLHTEEKPTASSPQDATLKLPFPAAMLEAWPVDGSALDRNAEIILYFNQPMNRVSVERAATFQPLLPGKFTWTDDMTLKFSPDLPLPHFSELKLSLAGTATAKNGQALQSPVALTYHLPAALKIIEQIPQPDSSGINPSAPLMISFNQPIEPLMAGAQTEDTPGFTLVPPADGKGTWINTSTYLFSPSTALKGGTTYQLTLRQDLAEAAQGAAWKFGTASIAVKSVMPAPEDGRLALDGSIQIQFNQPVNRQSVEQNVNLRSLSDSSQMEGHFTWNDSSTQATFKPARLLARDTYYALNLPASIQSASGETMTADKKFDYHTVAPLTLLGATPPNGGKLNYSGNYNLITLKFNSYLARQKFTSLVSLDPPVGDLSIYSTEPDTLMINGLFAPETKYQLKISPDLQDRWAGTLSVPLVLNFSTTPARASLNVPMLQYTDSLFLRPEDVDMNVQAVNVNSLLVQSQPLQINQFLSLSGNYQAKNSFVPLQNNTWMLHFSNTSQGKQVPLSLSRTGTPLKPGLYFYKLTSPDLDKSSTKEINFLSVVSHIQLTLKRSLKEMFVWAVDLNNNQPVAQRSLLLLNPSGDVVARCTTNSIGTCVFDLPADVKDSDMIVYYAVLGNPGEADFAMSLDSWRYGVSGYDFGIINQIQINTPFVYLYTDRPIYKPGQTVYFRTVVRKMDNGRYLPADLTSLNVKIMSNDSGDTHPMPVKIEIPLTLSSYGSAAGSFTLPEDAPVGTYHFEFAENITMDYAGFSVAAYRKPQVDLQVKFAAVDQKAGSDLSANVTANYYFGSPAAELPLSWTLNAVPDWFSMPDGFQAGIQDVLFYASDGANGREQEIASGSGVIGVDGSFQLTIPASDLGTLDTTHLNHLTLEVTLEDDSQSTVSARASMQLHPADVYIGVRPDSWGAQVGKAMSFEIQTTDWKTNPSSGQSLSARLQKVNWLQPDDSAGSTSLVSPTPIFSEVDSTDLKTDDDGQARISFVPEVPGDYRLELSGGGALTYLWLWVGGTGASTWANLPNQHLKISSDSSNYTAGQTAHLFIPNSLGANALALITVERSKVMESQVITINDASATYDLAVTEDMAPNVYVSVTLLGHGPDGRPDFRQGYQEIRVNPQKETLQVAFVAQPSSTIPGGDVLLALQVKDSKGKAVRGEFSVSLVDKAVLALADPNSKDIVSAFYGRNELGVFTSLSMASYINRISQFLAGGKGGGGGGNAAAIRQNFADTAFWQGNVETDDLGMAQMQVKLPDNLTTWVAQVRGLTQDTRVGEAELNIVTSKPLMVKPVTPRFGVVGDHIQLGAVVYNQTPTTLNSEVSLAVIGLKLDDPSQAVQKVTLNPMDNVRVNWWVTVEDVQAADMVFSAVAGNLVDQTHPEEGDLPVIRYETSQTTATMGLMTEAVSQSQLIQMPHSFVPTGGTLVMEFSPSLAAVVLNGLKHGDTPAFESNENLTSNLLPDLTVLLALQNDNQQPYDLKDGLDKKIIHNIRQMQANQNPDGGWGWASGYNSSDFMSAYVLLGLGEAARAGYLVDASLLQKAQQYMQNRLLTPQSVNNHSAYNLHVFMQFALQSSGVPDHFSGVSMEDWRVSYQFMDKLSPWAEALLGLGIKRAQPDNSMAGLIANDLISKALRMPSGIAWAESESDRANLSSPNFNTAVVVYALSQLSVDANTLNEAAHYLVVHQRANGGWNSSYENAWVLMGLGEVMVQNNDLKSNYGFSALLNNQLVTITQPDKVNYGSTMEQSIPFSQLRLDFPNTLTINRGPGNGRLFYRIFLKVNQPADTALPVQKGLTLTRRYELGGLDCPTFPCPVVTQTSLQKLKSPLTVHLSLVVPTPMYYMTVEDTAPAGVEIINRLLNTTKQGEEKQPVLAARGDPFFNGWNAWYFGSPVIGDHTIRWVAEQVPAGNYELTYQIQPEYSGQFHILPAHAYQIYFPEVEASSAGGMFDIQNESTK